MSLEVSNLSVGYPHGGMVLHDVSMKAEKGGITAIIGPNGAGKSTLLKAAYGFLKPMKGTVLFDGDNITGLDPREIIRRGLSYVPQGRNTFPYLSVLENLKMGAFILIKNDLNKGLRDVFDVISVLEEKRDAKAWTLSGGERRLLELGMALMLQPKLIMLDEPSLGLAPILLEEIYKKIRELYKMGVTFVIVEQNIQKVLSISDYAYVLGLGRNRMEGLPQDIIASGELTKLFIGR